MEPSVLERDRSLRREPLGELRGLLAESALGWVEDELRRSRLVARREVELDRALRTLDFAHTADLPPLVHEPAAARAGGLGDHVQDDGQESARVVGCGERFTDERKSLPERHGGRQQEYGDGRAGFDADLCRPCGSPRD